MAKTVMPTVSNLAYRELNVSLSNIIDLPLLKYHEYLLSDQNSMIEIGHETP